MSDFFLGVKIMVLLFIGREVLLWFLGVNRITERLDEIKKLVELTTPKEKK